MGNIRLPISTFEYTGEDIILEKGFIFDICKLFGEEFTPDERAGYAKTIIKVIKNNGFGDVSKFEELYFKPGDDAPTIDIDDNLLIEYTGDKNLRLKFAYEAETIRLFYLFEE